MWRILSIGLLFAVVLLATLAGRRSTPTAMFTEIAKNAGIHFVHARAELDPKLTHIMTWLTSLNAGACAADYDHDGDVDYYLQTSRPGARNALYRNEGNTTFVDVAASAGVDDVNNDEGLSMGCLFADYDNDGDQDLFVPSYGRSRLFANDGAGHFAEVGRRAGLVETGNTTAALFFDYDGDGWLDLMVGRYFPHDMRRLTESRVLQTSFEFARNGGRNLLYHNNHDGTFSEVGRAAGVDDSGWTLALGAGDLDDDGDLDVYVANDYGPDVVYRNNGNGTFTDVTADATGSDRASGMNVDLGDFDGDGRLDIYVANVTNPMFAQGNMLWHNLGGLRFQNVARDLGVSDGGWGWGGKFFDFDHDGDLDIYTVNGYVSAGETDLFHMPGSVYRGDVSDYRFWPDMRGLSLSGYERKRLFRREGGRFIEIASRAGVDSRADGRGIALADVDLDGDLDMLVTNVAAAPMLYRNDVGQDLPWLQVAVVGTRGNRDAIGTRLTVSFAGQGPMMREIDGGNGFSAQSARIAHFGLGNARTVDQLDIRWPDGGRRRYRDVPLRSLLIIEQ